MGPLTPRRDDFERMYLRWVRGREPRAGRRPRSVHWGRESYEPARSVGRAITWRASAQENGQRWNAHLGGYRRRPSLSTRTDWPVREGHQRYSGLAGITVLEAGDRLPVFPAGYGQSVLLNWQSAPPAPILFQQWADDPWVVGSGRMRGGQEFWIDRRIPSPVLCGIPLEDVRLFGSSMVPSIAGGLDLRSLGQIP